LLIVDPNLVLRSAFPSLYEIARCGGRTKTRSKTKNRDRACYLMSHYKTQTLVLIRTPDIKSTREADK
jgi:hypothetical protein